MMAVTYEFLYVCSSVICSKNHSTYPFILIFEFSFFSSILVEEVSVSANIFRNEIKKIR